MVTGIGKTNMCGAIGYTLALFGNPTASVLINLGIAGHPDVPLGTAFLAHKIIDVETGRRFYPQMPFAAPCSTHSVMTASRPHTDYSKDALYDMEAAGFYELAVKFSTAELIQVVKIVSDNQRSPIADINEATVENWTARQLQTIEALIAQLVRLRQPTLAEPCPLFHELSETFHFSVARSQKLKTLLQRWRLLKGDQCVAWREANARGAKELLIWLESQLEEMDFCL